MLNIDPFLVDDVCRQVLEHEHGQLAHHVGATHLRRHNHRTALLQRAQVSDGHARKGSVLAHVDLLTAFGVQGQLAVLLFDTVLDALYVNGAALVARGHILLTAQSHRLDLCRHADAIALPAIVDVAGHRRNVPIGLVALLQRRDLDIFRLGPLDQTGDGAESIQAFGLGLLLDLLLAEGGLQLDDLFSAEVDLHSHPAFAPHQHPICRLLYSHMVRLRNSGFSAITMALSLTAASTNAER